MTTTATNLRYSFNVNSSQFKKQDLVVEPAAVVILDNKPYETTSTSTTTTSSPVISSHHLELSTLCACNELITSNYDCADCGNSTSFAAIQCIETEYNKTKTQLNQLQTQRDLLRHDQHELDTKISHLKTILVEKKKDIQTTTQGIQSLKHDLQVLEIKCKEETTQVQNIQQSKENVKRELEELSQRLFEEANSMIVIEKAQQDILRKKNSQLEHDLQAAQVKLLDASSQLKLLRNEMEQHDDEYINRSTTLDEQPQQSPPSPITPQLEEMMVVQQTAENNVIDTYTRAQVETILMHGLDMGLHMDTLEDDGALMDFNDFIQVLHKTPLRKLHALKYMRYCVRDDIEPCLRFGPNPRLASKKIMEAIMVKSCFIEECPEGFVTEQAIRQLKEEAAATLWERFTTSSVFLGCQACGRNIDKNSREALLKYRFRISYFDEWSCIDRYCRDRLLAVIEFYLFIRHLRAGAYKHRSLHELYQQSIRLKLQMFLARMGALPNMLQNCGIHVDKIATAFHGEDINNSIILLSENASTIERLSSSTESTITISTVESSRTSASSS